jgi:hypothetical protein
MQYRGVAYEVIETITNSWRWSLKTVDGAYRVGIERTRKEAVLCAERAIDALLKRRDKPQ